MKIILIFLFLILIGGAVFGIIYYIKHEDTDILPISMFNTYFKCIDENTGKSLNGKITVVLGNSTLPYLEGDCNENGYVKYELPSDAIWHIFTKSDNYYTSHLVVLQSQDNLSYILSVYKIGDVFVKSKGKFEQGEGKINTTITTDYQLRKLKFCIDWGDNTIWVKLPFKEITIPKRLEGKVTKCYDSETTINEVESLNFTLEYKNFDVITNKDYIKIWVIDSDRDLTNNYIYEDEFGNGVGREDYTYIISKNAS